MFGARKHNRAELIFQLRQQKRPLARTIHQVDHLLNLLDGRALFGHLHIDRIVEELIGEFANFFWHGGRQKNGLAILRRFAHNSANGGEKP